MKGKRLFRILITMLFVICCSRNILEKREFNKHGISFIIPRGWRIDKDKETYIKDKVYTVCIEKAERGAHGSFTVACSYREMEILETLNSFMQNVEKGFKNNPLFRSSKTQFSEKKGIVFKGNEGFKVNFSVRTWAAKLIGEIYSFKWNGYTIILVFFVDEEKYEEIKDDFQIIKDSFHCLNNEEY